MPRGRQTRPAACVGGLAAASWASSSSCCFASAATGRHAQRRRAPPAWPQRARHRRPPRGPPSSRRPARSSGTITAWACRSPGRCGRKAQCSPWLLLVAAASVHVCVAVPPHPRADTAARWCDGARGGRTARSGTGRFASARRTCGSPTMPPPSWQTTSSVPINPAAHSNTMHCYPLPGCRWRLWSCRVSCVTLSLLSAPAPPQHSTKANDGVQVTPTHTSGPAGLDWLVFSGGFGTGPHSGANLLGWTKPEAEVFSERVRTMLPTDHSVRPLCPTTAIAVGAPLAAPSPAAISRPVHRPFPTCTGGGAAQGPTGAAGVAVGETVILLTPPFHPY